MLSFPPVQGNFMSLHEIYPLFFIQGGKKFLKVVLESEREYYHLNFDDALLFFLLALILNGTRHSRD